MTKETSQHRVKEVNLRLLVRKQALQLRRRVKPRLISYIMPMIYAPDVPSLLRIRIFEASGGSFATPMKMSEGLSSSISIS